MMPEKDYLNKKPLKIKMINKGLSTRGGNRTHTPKELDFESSASTNSATRANVRELGSPKIGRQK